MQIGILECGHLAPEIAAKHGDYPTLYARMLDGAGFTFQSYDVANMYFPDTVRECDGWLITGSRNGAYDDVPFIAPMESFIRDAYQAHVPLVGICFGHQIIAQALGGRVEKYAGGWAVGRQEYDFDDLGTIALNAWHQDQVTRPPEEAKCVARSPFCENAALVYGTRAFTVQPHPEFDGSFIADFVESRRGLPEYDPAQLDTAKSNSDQPDNNADLSRKIIAFFEQSREASHV